MYTCMHCLTGIVRTLPAHCPECERLLSAIVENKYLYKTIDDSRSENSDGRKNPQANTTGSI
jgi:hypothetical protein